MPTSRTVSWLCDSCRTEPAVRRLAVAPFKDVCAWCGIEELKCRIMGLYAQIYETENEVLRLEAMLPVQKGL